MNDRDIKKIKEEIKQELRLEMRSEFKELVKEEIRTIIFEERYFETPLRAYIKSLAYDDVHYLRMLNAGMVNYGTTIIEIPEMSSGSLKMKLKKDVDIKKMYEEYAKAGLIHASIQDFESIVNFESESGYIYWMQKARKGFTYKGIFELYEFIYDDDFFNLNPLLEKRFLAYISNKFLLGNEFKNTKDFEKSFNKIYKNKSVTSKTL